MPNPRPRSPLQVQRGRRVGPPSLPKLAADLPPVVYFVRTSDDLIKIGYTASLRDRRRSLGVKWDDVLAIVPGTLADEQAAHALFAEYLARGREYFHPAPALVEHINIIRGRLGVASV